MHIPFIGLDLIEEVVSHVDFLMQKSRRHYSFRFWNAERYSKELRKQRKYGFNMIMCNTEKGRNLYNETISKFGRIELPLQIAVDGDVRLRHAEKAPLDRDSIFQEYHTHGYEWLVNNRGPKNSIASRLTPTWVKNLIYEIKSRI